MLRVLGRRGLEAGISLFAVLGFCYVPLGSHTGLQHAKAIFGTAAAKRAGVEVRQAFSRVRSKLTGEVEELASSAATAVATPGVSPAPHKSALHNEHARHPPPSE